jgi:uncharacterized membrane protein
LGAGEAGKPDELSPFPAIRLVGIGAPWKWLREGWRDFRRAPGPSVFYGVVLASMGVVLTQFAGHGAIELAFLTGFLIVGPFLLMGLYDISRRLRGAERVDLGLTLFAWKANAPAIGFFAMILALLLAVWLRISVVVVALFFPDGLMFVGAYACAGLGFALFVFATSVVSLPMLLDRPNMDALTAMITSFNALRLNTAPMLLWAAIVVVLTAFGFASFYAGLVVVLPVIGHATWHAYRETVEGNA